MQPKVSMVIPCYNKEKYIAGMFDSVLAQEWDNIELILVNDGSTDRTREIITEYEAKFLARGYEVVIVDQENRGLPGAVYSGLLRITGEFVCQVDADDELDPRYVSIMAGWLWENPDYEWAACDIYQVRHGVAHYVGVFPEGGQEVYQLEKWLMAKFRTGIWKYMVRATYMIRCNVTELFYTGRDGNQEAQFQFPLSLGKGKLKYFYEPLYKYNRYFMENPSIHRSYIDSYEKSKKRWLGFINATKEVVGRMPLEEPAMRRLCAVAELTYLGWFVVDALNYGTDAEIAESISLLIDSVKKHFTPSSLINAKQRNWQFHALPLIAAIEHCILGTVFEPLPCLKGRKIAWGVLGKYGKAMLLHLKNTSYEPDELWDARGDGIMVKKPDIASLKSNDTVFVLTKFGANTAGILKELKEVSCNIVTYDNILAQVAQVEFPAFYDGSLRFLE